ncbi:sodium/potassium/calcium exchanger 3-like isoform X2 [Plodia interpunctella]|uniref:sodium/potassium/calcium exchanger 3-like isoform X2 n=1 Tax=Plodia interpunctella TaxID=58824 RepID=UPI002368CA4D|nr:sodium/potassium/calcium exchanger 3-like isoform X2 [Plodia interpunctella]
MKGIVLGLIALLACSGFSSAFNEHNDSNNNMWQTITNSNGEDVLISMELMRRLEEERETWHVRPWIRTKTEVLEGIVHEVTCYAIEPNSFPQSPFDDDQLKKGAFLLYALFGIYAFTLLAIVCNDFFIPCVELICEDLKIPQNVAAATFMSVATSCPEFFVNVISTFLTESDMGIGTIVGSAIFNALGVAAIGGLAAVSPIAIESRPVTRDVIIYMVNVSVLVVIVWDSQVDWYEAVVLGVLYVLYFVLMFNSVRLFDVYDRMVARCCGKSQSSDLTVVVNGGVDEGNVNKGFDDNLRSNGLSEIDKVAVVDEVLVEDTDQKTPKSIWKLPKGKSVAYTIWWFYSWPLKLILNITIPSPIKYRKFYPLAFIMCIIWIGVNSYFVSWSMTVMGETFLIPDSVMGMTFLAFGGCLPEACSIYIMSRRGEGGIGVSNALGANSLAILFALGVPWLIKTLTLLAQGAELTAVEIDSNGIDFVIASLLVAVACLWLTLFIGKFKLRKSVGFVLAVLYVVFITFAILTELGVILDIDRMARCLF